ncbi:MAG: ATP-binding protein [Desulfobacteraceae bacterium]|nr:ATP-binding protein [Desulfobacteraceae bacterium]
MVDHMDAALFAALVNGTDNFFLRRAVERIRDGLFDPLGVQWLTSGKEKLDQVFDQGVARLETDRPCHVCVCGAYGQGKSHSLAYLKQRALAGNFVVSSINLDPRQIPFHDFKAVYRALMGAMTFPDGESRLADVWKEFARQWQNQPENRDKTLPDIIPANMPHRIRAILAAMASPNMDLPPNKRKLKKHVRFKPREFPWILKNALMGKDIPAHRLQAAFHYRQVAFYKDHSLVCNEPSQYLAAVKGLAELLKTMGFRGWMVLFDEGESIGQTRITSRSKSYELLHEFICPDTGSQGLFPVFAFTHDFFTLVADESYDRTRTSRGRKKDTSGPDQIPCFARNYHRAWKQDLNIHLLQDLSARDWQGLIRRLVMLHGKAYGWAPDSAALEQAATRVLSRHGRAESRMKLRVLVNQMDLAQQNHPG